AAAKPRRARPAVLGGLAPQRSAGAALRRLRHESLSGHALLSALPLRSLRLARRRADGSRRNVVRVSPRLFRRSAGALGGISGEARLRRALLSQSGGGDARRATHRPAGRGGVRGGRAGGDVVEVQAAEGLFIMKAMVVRAPGGTDVLKIEQIADPAPG